MLAAAAAEAQMGTPMGEQFQEEDWSKHVLVEDGVRKAISGYTWPGIEYGEPPNPEYTFFEYVDTVRQGDLEAFKRIQAATQEWWFPTLDRGAGALLHFAVDHGRFEIVKYLIEDLKVPVNQRSHNGGWTPLHRCAHVVHYKNAPRFEIFEYLLQRGANPQLLTLDEKDDYFKPCTAFDLVVRKGYQWEEGEVRKIVSKLIEKYKDIPHQEEFTYSGPDVGEIAYRVQNIWENLSPLYPPENWSGAPPPGFEGAMGMRRHDIEPWRPAGDNDGSYMMRPMTEKELQEEEEMQYC